jgi:hypothetical protein
MLQRHIPLLIAIFLSLEAIIFLIGCGSSPSQNLLPAKSEKTSILKQYPDWLWNMPIFSNTLYAVGFSETSALHQDESERRAIEDGIKSLAIYYSIHLKADQKNIRGIELNYWDSDAVIEEISPETEKYIQDNNQVIKKFVSPEYTYVLLRLGAKDDFEPEISVGSSIIPKEPLWMTALPKEAGYIYATGESSLYFRETDSWRIAEKKARLALALCIEAKVKNLVKSLDNQMVTISQVSTDVHLNNVQVVERWKNMEMGSCHVLLRMKTEDGYAIRK